MAQKKANEVDNWLARPDQKMGIVLFYGPDHGLVSERAARFVKMTGLPLDDPFSVVQLDADETEEGGRLTGEANTVSMFTDKRLIWVRNAQSQRGLADEVKSLCENPPEATIIVIEAKDLKKGAPLRATVESSPNAIALPCYADAERDLDTIIDDMLARSGMRINMEARTALRKNLGGDRLASRSELEKLELYALGKQVIELSDVLESTGDAAEISADSAVDAVLEGRLDVFDMEFQRYFRSGTAIFLIASGLMRQLQLLRVMRAELDGKRKSASEIVASARPPIFFGRRKTIETALRRWTLPQIDRALERLQFTVLETRRRPDLAASAVHRACIALAAEAARAR